MAASFVATLTFAAFAGFPSAVSASGTHPATVTVPPQGTATSLISVPLAAAPTVVVVDDAHQEVFVSTNSHVVVVGFDGTTKATITVPNARSLAVSADGSVVYASNFGKSTIEAIDASTFAATTIATPGVAPEYLTYTGGKVWFIGSSGLGLTPGLASYDPATSTISTPSSVAPLGVRLWALAGRPQRLVSAADGPVGTSVIDVSGATPSVVASSSLECDGNVALINNGDRMIGGCGNAAPPLNVYDTATLESVGSVAAPSTASIEVAASEDGQYVASQANLNEPGIGHLAVTDISGGLPGQLVRTVDLDGIIENQGGGNADLAWGAGDMLFVGVEVNGVGKLDIIPDATKSVPPAAFTTGPRVQFQAAAHITGTIGYAPGAATSVKLTRTDANGTVVIPSVPVAGDGTFDYADTGTKPIGLATYRLDYAGDATHAAVMATTKVLRGAAPYDFNADGYADLALGVPKEDVGKIVDAGEFQVLYGHADGVTGTGSLGITQDTVGVPGSAEKGDEFGAAMASGDFNGDGYADLAVSAPLEDVGSIKDAGAIWVFYGSAAGLRTDNAVTLPFTEPSLVSEGAELGISLAAGDVGTNDLAGLARGTGADGYDDLVIGSNEADYVFFAQGGPGGLGQADLIVNGPGTGRVVAVGDVNGDGQDEIAVGGSTRPGNGFPNGAVSVLDMGNQHDPGSLVTFTEDSPGVPGVSHAATTTDLPDGFGSSIAFGDFNGDGKADLAIGAPGANVTTSDSVTHKDAGSVTVLYSNGTQIGTTGAVQITQDTIGVPGSPGAGDEEGTTIAAGDVTGDGIADLAMFSPGDHYVMVIPGAAGGLKFSATASLTQSSAGITGTDTAGDRWGQSLRFESFRGPGPEGVAVGAPGKHSGAGSVTVLVGITGTGSEYFDQNSADVPGAAESGDAFGTF